MISTPPPRSRRRLSKVNSLNLSPTIGSRKHPLPLPPVKVREVTELTSKLCGSTWTSFTLPVIIGSTFAVPAKPAAISICGGFTTSYPFPEFKISNSLIGP